MEIPAGAQVFDLVFHPTVTTVYAGLLTGHVEAFAYDNEGNHEPVFTIRPSKRSCRGLSINEDGSQLYAVGKSKSLHIIDTNTQAIDTLPKAHDSPINRVKYLMPGLICTGDDDGVIKLWDPRQRDCLRAYTQHFDYITDFLWLGDKKQLVATSGDGSLSVMDVRSKKLEPLAHSEDQEDELLSIVAIRGDTKAVVGTQLGVLSIFNRNKGWGDCVDRIPGHPMSIDALCNIPPDIPGIDASSVILTGSSDGYVRAVQLFPTKLLGLVTDHGEWPVERIAVGEGRQQLSIGSSAVKGVGQSIHRRGDDDDDDDDNNHTHGPWWVGSVGHEEVLRMSNLEAFLRKDKKEELDDSDSDSEGGLKMIPRTKRMEIVPVQMTSKLTEATHDDESEAHRTRKRKRKPEKDPLEVKKRKGKNELEVDGAFFNEL
ncbi:WD40-repeat-containing domain protein [Amanita rubescens]|nr:WD40-repeat-containing domain protein [Amanita rubescens]